MKNPKRTVLIVLTAGAGAVFAFAMLLRFVPINFNTPSAAVVEALPQQPERVNDQAQEKSVRPANPGEPVELEIPEIDVEADVDYVGINAKGLMDITQNPETVAWYEPGTRPGEIGSAVMAGHYGTWKSGQGSVFDRLQDLRKGDKVYVKDDKGQRLTFVVRESRRFEPDADATEVFTSDDGKAHLNLITCEGEWNDVSQGFSQRLVVFTDLE